MGIPAAGIAAMGKRWQNQSVVTQGYCAGADVVSWGKQGRWVAGPYREPQGSESVPTKLHRFYRLEPHLSRGGDAGTRASHPTVTQEPKLQHFGQLLSNVRHYELYLQLTGASRCCFN